jgi:tetratricopeptide (TPR) repeat protein
LGDDEDGMKFIDESFSLNGNSILTKINIVESLMMEASNFLTACHAYPLAQEAISQEVLTSGKQFALTRLLAILDSQKGDYRSALAIVEAEINDQFGNKEAWETLGDLYFKIGNEKKGIDAMETALSLSGTQLI